jgi:ABC-type transporter Mla subunit MlaD
VTTIEVLPTNHIRVRVEIRPRVVRIRQGMTAQLNNTGITGQLVVNITGGETEGAILPANATIPSTPSLFANLSTELPEILASINALLGRIEKTLGEEGPIASIVRDASGLVLRVDTTVTDVGTQTQALLQHADRLLENDMRPLLADLRTTTQTARRVLDRTDASLQTTLASSTRTFQQLEKQLAALDLKTTNTNLQAALRQVTELTKQYGHSSEELNLTLQHLRGNTANVEFNFRQAARSLQETMVSAKQLFDSLERDPTVLLFGKRTPGYARDGQRR